LIAVPYAAWGAELSPDYHDRARITGAREAAMVLGVVAAGGLPSLLAYLGQSETSGLAAIAWLAIAVGAPAIVLLVWRVRDGGWRNEPARTRAPFRLNRQSLAPLLANRPFVRLLAGWFVNGLANGLPSALFPLYLRHGLGAGTAASGVLIMANFLLGVAAIPAWLALSRRFGKHRVWCWAMIMACLAFVWVPFLQPGQIAAFFVICVITGTAIRGPHRLEPRRRDLDAVDATGDGVDHGVAVDHGPIPVLSRQRLPIGRDHALRAVDGEAAALLVNANNAFLAVVVGRGSQPDQAAAAPRALRGVDVAIGGKEQQVDRNLEARRGRDLLSFAGEGQGVAANQRAVAAHAETDLVAVEAERIGAALPRACLLGSNGRGPRRRPTESYGAERR
jgi:hypothetical protein